MRRRWRRRWWRWEEEEEEGSKIWRMMLQALSARPYPLPTLLCESSEDRRRDCAAALVCNPSLTNVPRCSGAS